MKSILDNAYELFLDTISYNEKLVINVIEGIKAEEAEDLEFGENIIEGTYRVEPNENSRKFQIVFESPITWQVTDESYTSWDDYEIRDDKNSIQILEKSKFFDYIMKNHGWFEDVVGPGKHYRILTLDQIIDVISCDVPIIDKYTTPNKSIKKRDRASRTAP